MNNGEPMKNFILKHKSIILYVIFGGMTTIVDWTVSFILYSRLNPHVANVIAWVTAVLFAFAVNKIWVYESKTKGFIPVSKELVSFSLGRLSSLGLQELIVFLAVDLGGIDIAPVKICASVLVVIVNYILGKLTFKKGAAKNNTDN